MRDPDSGWLQLSTTEFVVLWAALDLGDLPAALELAPLARTSADADRLGAEVSAALTGRDLGTVQRPARDVAVTMRAFAGYRACLDVVVHGDGAALRGIAAAGRSSAALARVGTEIRMGPVHPDRLVDALLGSLTARPAGPGRPVNIGVAEFTAACAEGDRDGVTGFLRAIQAAGLRTPEANTLVHAITGRRGGGQLGGSTGGTGAHRAGTVLTWLDTDDGRYALRRGGDWLTVTPVDAARLAGLAAELLDEVSGARR